MDHTFWHKQLSDKALFPDLLWSRPENKRQAGKLLIVGGNAHGFSAAGEAFTETAKAGIGTARVLLPNSLQKTVGRVFEAGEYAPSTPSGSFGQQALAELLAMSQWADATLVAGDLGRNSETAILLEQFVTKYIGQLTLTKDAVDYFTKSPDQLLTRENTLLVMSFAQLQKIAINMRFLPALTFGMGFLRLVEALHEFTQKYPTAIILKHAGSVIVATSGQVSTTKLEQDHETWRIRTAAHAAVWWLQNPSKTFEALTTSLTENPAN